jgi:hypothetical protein
VHRYLEAAPACWAAYGEVLAREYADTRYFAAHQATVDAYAVQHPGRPSPQTIRSAALHLLRLCLMIEHGLDARRATAAMQAATKVKARFHWLEPPADRGARTVVNSWAAVDADEHVALAQGWARCAWAAWGVHHDQVRAWARAYL